ncbi:MAG: hypothetical protein JSR31_08870 [Nitrospira sp.]|nr:hypothetical protein [Nitrospira sp.]
MLHLLPIYKLIAITAIVITTIALVIQFHVNSNATVATIVSTVIQAITIGEIVFVVIMTIVWRKIWSSMPVLGHWYFPDLNGTWSGEIRWCWNGKAGTKPVVARIRQNLLRINVYLSSDESESETLAVHAGRDVDSGIQKLFYIYRNTPRDSQLTTNPRHEGAAILLFKRMDRGQLAGNYFTNRDTKGEIILYRNTDYYN